MRKIGYKRRSFFKEYCDDDLMLIKNILSSESIVGNTVNSLCEVPCGKLRNINLCELFKHVYFIDINKTMLKVPNVSYNNYTAICGDFKNLPRINVEMILISRQALQMFSIERINKFLKDVRSKTTAKFVLIDIFYYDGKNLKGAPNYFTNNIEVYDEKTKKTYVRRTFININKGLLNLKHTYFLENAEVFEFKINIYNYNIDQLKKIFLENKYYILEMFDETGKRNFENSNRVIFLLEVNHA